MTDDRRALAGDWHGNRLWSQSRIMDAQRAGAKRIYHLGDFGIWPGVQGEAFLDKMNRTCEFAKIDIWVTPGNHEDWDQINRVPVSDDGLQWIRPRIALIPRGHRWTDGGRTFVIAGWRAVHRLPTAA